MLRIRNAIEMSGGQFVASIGWQIPKIGEFAQQTMQRNNYF